MSRSCELAGCGRGNATRCGTAYLCPTCRPGIEALTAELLAETRPPAYVEGSAVVWAGQTGAWILHGYEDDHSAWIYRPGVRMVPVVGRSAGGWIDLNPGRREPEHMELAEVTELRPAVEAKGGVR